MYTDRKYSLIINENFNFNTKANEIGITVIILYL